MKQPKATCSRCGRTVWRSKTSRPQIVCQPCRRKRKGPYRPRRSKAEGGSEVHDESRRTPQRKGISPRERNVTGNAVSDFNVRVCSKCGAEFVVWPTGGRPRARCDRCRSNLEKIDGVAWRKLRAQVMAEEPICAVPGRGRLSTEVDHIHPLKFHPELGLVRSNLQGMCKSHNAAKGALTARSANIRRWEL